MKLNKWLVGALTWIAPVCALAGGYTNSFFSVPGETKEVLQIGSWYDGDDDAQSLQGVWKITSKDGGSISALAVSKNKGSLETLYNVEQLAGDEDEPGSDFSGSFQEGKGYPNRVLVSDYGDPVLINTRNTEATELSDEVGERTSTTVYKLKGKISFLGREVSELDVVSILTW